MYQSTEGGLYRPSGGRSKCLDWPPTTARHNAQELCADGCNRFLSSCICLAKSPTATNWDELVDHFTSWVNRSLLVEPLQDRWSTHQQPCGGLALTKVVGKVHPNIYELIKVTKREEALTTMRVQQWQVLHSSPEEVGDRKIQTFFQILELGAVTLEDDPTGLYFF